MNESMNEPEKKHKKTFSVCVTNIVEGKTYWTKIGVAFPHNEGNGFNIIIPPNISVSGKLIVIEDKEERKEHVNTGHLSGSNR